MLRKHNNDRGNRGAAQKVSNSKQVLLMLLYSLQTQNRSPFPAEVMKTTNNERFYIN